jgi:mRNA interferase MazF
MLHEVKRGDMYFADLSPAVGSEQSGLRPVLVVQNNRGNRHSPTVVVAAISGKRKKLRLPTHVVLSANCGLTVPSVVLCEQLRTLDKCRLQEYIGALDTATMIDVYYALAASVGLKQGGQKNAN